MLNAGLHSVVDVPNSQRGLKRLEYRTKEWDPDFREYLKNLNEKKPVIVCGDMNVAHEEIGEWLACCVTGVTVHPQGVT